MATADGSAMRAALESSPFVARLVWSGVTGSTNDDCIALAERGAPAGTVVVADAQSGGRGRLDRTWHSPPGLGLYVSVLFRPERPPDELPRFTLAAAVAACESCRDLVGNAVRIKWPNDVVAEGRKLAGVLAEARSAAGRPAWLVVGTGINVGHEAGDFPEELRERATSLRALAPHAALDRAALARAFVDRLGAHAAELTRGRFEELAAVWQRLANGAVGARVRSIGGLDRFEGITRGLDRTGALLVETAEGKLVAIRQGESLEFGEDPSCSSRSTSGTPI